VSEHGHRSLTLRHLQFQNSSNTIVLFLDKRVFSSTSEVLWKRFEAGLVGKEQTILLTLVLQRVMDDTKAAVLEYQSDQTLAGSNWRYSIVRETSRLGLEGDNKLPRWARLDIVSRRLVGIIKLHECTARFLINLRSESIENRILKHVYGEG